MYELSNYIEARKIIDCSMVEVASIMHTTKQTISNLERGVVHNEMTIEFYKQTITKLIKEKMKGMEHIAKTLELLSSCKE